MTPELTARQVAAIDGWLRVFLVPGQVVSIQALYGPRRARSVTTGDVAEAARVAAELDATSPLGVYFTPNPIRPDLAGSPAFPKDEDVIRRHWLLIDVDPDRPSGTSSTEAETAAAAAVLDRCRGMLDSAGLTGAVVGFAGNGWHLCYPIDAPNDTASKEVIRAVLKGLQARCGDVLTTEEKAIIKAGDFMAVPKAHVGTECHDAKRIWACYGTQKRKGQHMPERPHRWARLIAGEPWEAVRAAANWALLPRLLERWQYIDDVRKGRPQTDQHTYATAALRQELAAIAAAPVGDRNNQLNKSAFVLATLVAAGTLSLSEVEGALLGQALAAGLDEAEARATVASGIKAGLQQPRDLSRVGTLPLAVPPPGLAQEAGKPAEVQIVFPAPIPASQLKEGPQAPAIWRGFLNRGAITLFYALWKAGKTTLLTHLIRGMETGGQFCGLDLSQGSVLYVTEESETRWAKRRDRHCLRDHIEFVIRPFVAKPGLPHWMALLDYINGLLVKQPRDVVIFDTLTNLWPVKDENDASQVQAALMPLHAMPAATGQLLVHHTRKSDGQEATASRGSGALPAFADTIVEFRRFSQTDCQDRRRVLKGYGRDEDIPDELVVELTELDGYVAQGKRTEVKAKDLGADILPLLPQGPPGLTFEEIMKKLPGVTKPQRQASFYALAQGLTDNLWQRSGRGVKGDPYRYYVAVPTVNGFQSISSNGEEPETETIF